MTAKDMPTTGAKFGSYNLVEKIAEGSMGTVYKAQHGQTNQIVAIKVLAKEIARNAVVLKRFEQEFRVAGKVDHPHIVKVIEYCATGESPYIVMEYVEGESLGDRLERSGPLSEDVALYIILQAAHGLHRAHAQGLIHRDIKPDNILVNSANDAKIADLGLAKDLDGSADLTRTGRGLGTPSFMAPEQFRNAKNASVRCDVYSLGATLYQMVTGKLPFGVSDPVQAMMRKLRNDVPSPRSLVPELSERVDWAIRRAMSADPEQRPGSCREFVEDLTGQSTRMGEGDDENGVPAADPAQQWYLMYNDEEGMGRTATGSSDELRPALKAGAHGNLNAVRVSRSATGPFVPLSVFAEFRDLVVTPGLGPSLSEDSAANLSKLSPLAQGGHGGSSAPPGKAPPAAAPAEEPVQLRLAVRSAKPKPDLRSQEWLKVLLILIVGLTTMILAARYLLPLLPPLR
ncbi:hypothetical protein AYO44_02655 [Planctomycetaceae bacterium SCGC AG-212-F19]|nr:hypothetical protein AYO44_02655 [Planctomycetaceae bacterium SCGC AG-212-F19]